MNKLEMFGYYLLRIKYIFMDEKISFRIYKRVFVYKSTIYKKI